jgi:hypothetical protein
LASDLKDPQAVHVNATISFQETIDALSLYVKKYPVERVSVIQIRELENAINTLVRRYVENKRKMIPNGDDQD